MTATAADVVSETTLATMARDARGLAIDSISAVGTLVCSAFEQVRRHSKIIFSGSTESCDTSFRILTTLTFFALYLIPLAFIDDFC